MRRAALISGAFLLLGAAAVLTWPSSSAPPSPGPRWTQQDAPATKPASPRRKIPSRPSASPPATEWTTNTSGLVWVDLVEGTGDTPEHRAVVSIDYTGWLESGRLFDSSFKRPTPYRFVLGADTALKGLDEAVSSMRVGGKRLLRLPPELHYGPVGRPPRIPPQAILLIEVELREVGDIRLPPSGPPMPGPQAWQDGPQGLKLAVLQSAAPDAAAATRGSRVSVEYSGWLEDGTLFDSSLNSTDALSFVLGKRTVIPGWEVGIEGMQVGERRLLRIPPELAYGARGFPPLIGADATLTFQVELIAVE